MTRRKVSDCCEVHYTEEPSEFDGVEFTPVCSNCKRPCKIKIVGEPDGKPRTAAQAYNDSFDENGNLKAENDPEVFQDAPQTPLQGSESHSEAFKVKGGLIYHDGKVIGKSLPDRELYKEQYGEEWKGSDEALKKVLGR